MGPIGEIELKELSIQTASALIQSIRPKWDLQNVQMEELNEGIHIIFYISNYAKITLKLRYNYVTILLQFCNYFVTIL